MTYLDQVVEAPPNTIERRITGVTSEARKLGEESYDVGAAYRFLDSTSDGRTVLVSRYYSDDDRSDVPALLRLDPALWRETLCSVIDLRDLTETERQTENKQEVAA